MSIFVFKIQIDTAQNTAIMSVMYIDDNNNENSNDVYNTYNKYHIESLAKKNPVCARE